MARTQEKINFVGVNLMDVVLLWNYVITSATLVFTNNIAVGCF